MSTEPTLTEVMQTLDKLIVTVGEQFLKIDKRIDKLETTMNDRFDLMDKKFEARTVITENRLQVVKNVIEHDLATAVPW